MASCLTHWSKLTNLNSGLSNKAIWGKNNYHENFAQLLCLTFPVIHGFSYQQGTFIHVPKKPGGLKPELIDVDLVIGMYMYIYFLLLGLLFLFCHHLCLSLISSDQ